MNFYNNHKVLEISKTLFVETYPESECFVLTGSQLEEEFVSVVSDIDILIIDSRISGISSFGFNYGDYRVDFTRIGFHFLHEAIIDSCYSNSNTIVDMIIKGVFINDKFGIEQSLKSYCKMIVKNSNLNYFTEFKAIRRSLLKSKKNFNKELKEYQIPLTISDFLLNITKAYLFFCNNGKYGFDGYRRSRMLYYIDGGMVFLESLNRITADYYKTRNNTFIVNEIDRFLDYSLLNTGKLYDFKFVLNIKFKGENSFLFFTKLVKGIISDSALSNKFYYGQRVFKDSIFKFEYLLVFESTEETVVLSGLQKLVKELNLECFEYTTIDPFYLKEIWQEEEVINKVDSVMKQLNYQVLQVLSEEKKFNFRRLIPLFVYVLEILRSDNYLSLKEIYSILDFLRLKYKKNSYYHNLNHNNIEEINQVVYNLDYDFLLKNNDVIAFFSSKINSNTFIKDVEEELPLILDLKLAVCEIRQYISNKDLSPNFMRPIMDNSKIQHNKSWCINLLDASLKSMGLNENMYSFFIVFVKGIYKL